MAFLALYIPLEVCGFQCSWFWFISPSKHKPVIYFFYFFYSYLLFMIISVIFLFSLWVLQKFSRFQVCYIFLWIPVTLNSKWQIKFPETSHFSMPKHSETVYVFERKIYLSVVCLGIFCFGLFLSFSQNSRASCKKKVKKKSTSVICSCCILELLI